MAYDSNDDGQPRWRPIMPGERRDGLSFEDVRRARALRLGPVDTHPTIFGLYRSWTGLYFALVVTAGFLLFAPPAWLGVLGVDAWVRTNRVIIGLGFVLFLVLFVVALLGPATGRLAHAATRALHTLAVGRPLRHLSEPEQALLYWCLHHNLREFYVPEEADTAHHLVDKHVLVPMGISHKPGKEGFISMHVRKDLWPKLFAQEDHLRKAMHMNHPAVADTIHALNKANH